MDRMREFSTVNSMTQTKRRKNTKREMILWLAVLLGYLGVFYKIELFNLNLKGVIILLAFGLVASYFHLKENKQRGCFVETVLGVSGAGSAKRSPQYDHLRVCACVFVCTTHCLQVAINRGMVESVGLAKLFTFLYLITLSCNPIYVMLSGALMLPPKNESWATYYKKRILKILLPLIVYYYWYLWQNKLWEETNIVTVIRNMLKFNTPVTPHFWLIYLLLLIQLTVPVLRIITKRITYRVLSLVAGFCFAFLIYRNVFPGIQWTGSALCNWFLVFIIGYWVSRNETRDYDKYLICAGVLATLFTAVLVWVNGNYRLYVYGCTPVLCLVAAGFMAIILGTKGIFTKQNLITMVLSKYSYSIILIHWWVLHWETYGVLEMNPAKAAGLATIPVIGVTIVLSIAIGIFLDNYICYPIERLLKAAAGALMSLQKKN